MKTTKEVASRLIELCRKGDFETAYAELYSQEIESFEMKGSPREHLQGIDAVMKKGEMWADSVEELFGVEVSEPLFADEHFSILIKMDIKFKETDRKSLDELCVYRVQDGKIVSEHFFYNF